MAYNSSHVSLFAEGYVELEDLATVSSYNNGFIRVYSSEARIKHLYNGSNFQAMQCTVNIDKMDSTVGLNHSYNFLLNEDIVDDLFSKTNKNNRVTLYASLSPETYEDLIKDKPISDNLRFHINHSLTYNPLKAYCDASVYPLLAEFESEIISDGKQYYIDTETTLKFIRLIDPHEIK